MNVLEFIDKINESVPTIERIIAKYKWDSSESSVQNAKMVQNDYRISVKPGSNELSDLEFLIDNTDMSEVQKQMGSIVFQREIEVIDAGFKWFATFNDYHKLCLNQEDGSIVWVDSDADEYEPFAVSLDQFFSFMYIYDLYEKSMVWGAAFSKAGFAGQVKELIENGLNEWIVSTLIPDWPWA